MEFEKIIKEQKSKIIEELVKKGYANKTIGYSEFSLIYGDYKSLMSEKEFAYLLGLTHDQYDFLKNRGSKSQILRIELTEERKEEIRKELTERGYTNRKVNYEEFLKLYENYKLTLTEKDFAAAIGIANSSYSYMKNKNGNAVVLNTPIDEKAIREEVEQNYESTMIDYEEFLKIYEKYKDVVKSESRFATIIGVSKGGYDAMKNKGYKTKILNRDDIPDDLKKEIFEDISRRDYINKKIGYEEFLNLYETYKDKMSEIKFAKVVGITAACYNHMRYRDNYKTYILKASGELSAERKSEIKNKFIEQGYANKVVDYAGFLELYSEYKSEMSEIQFAEILGISYNHYNTIKTSKTNATLLRTKNIDEKLKEEILKNPEVKKLFGQKINREMFLEVYKQYSNYMTETQFAQIIGITYASYKKLKKNNVVPDAELNKRERMKYFVNESRRYSKEEISKICEEYGITEDEFLRLVFKDKDELTINEYKEILNEKGLFIGRKPISNEILEKHGQEIVKYINKVGEITAGRFRENKLKDGIVSDATLYIMQKRGDIFENYEEKDALRVIKNIALAYVINSFTNNLSIKELSIDKMHSEQKSLDRKFADKKVNVENEAINNIDLGNENKDKAEKCMMLLEEYYKKEYSAQDIIEKVSEQLDLSKRAILEILQEKLESKKEINENANENDIDDDNEKTENSKLMDEETR